MNMKKFGWSVKGCFDKIFSMQAFLETPSWGHAQTEKPQGSAVGNWCHSGF